jgi:peptide/nickel transport system ATP-binding protein
MPSMDPDARTEEPPLAGDPPNPIDPPAGCRFHTRCPIAERVCGVMAPLLTATGPRHAVACHARLPGSGHARAAA